MGMHIGCWSGGSWADPTWLHSSWFGSSFSIQTDSCDLSISGDSAVLNADRWLSCLWGSLSSSGLPVSFKASRSIIVDSLAAQIAAGYLLHLVIGRKIPAISGIISCQEGETAYLIYDRRIYATSGTSSISGSLIHTAATRYLHVDKCNVAISGSEIPVIVSRLIEIEGLQVYIAGLPITLSKFRPGVTECDNGSFHIIWGGTATLIKITKGNRVVIDSRNRSSSFCRKNTEIIYPVSRRAA